MQLMRQLIIISLQKHSNIDVIAHKYLIQHLRHIGPVQLVEAATNFRHRQPRDTMLLTVTQSTLETVTQVSKYRLMKVTIFGDEIVDVAVITPQNSNFTNTNVC